MNSCRDEIIEKIAINTIEYLLDHPRFPKNKITNLKAKFAKNHSFNGVIKNATILEISDSLNLSRTELRLLNRKLKRRSTRTISGVSVIAIMTKPLKCPGECIYCPGEYSQPGQKVAQSYTGREPAAMRSIHYNYDPFAQVSNRIKDLEAIGHKVDKIELIVMGGTFLSTNPIYQKEFIKGAIEAIIEKHVNSLKIAKANAENSTRRLIGITVETRPDYCKEEHVDLMLNYGTTRVELGIQTIYEEIYKLVKRGHTVQDSIDAIRIAKDAGLKVNAHIMPNLPGSNYIKDLNMFRDLFSNSEYRPDMLKIYPCLVIKGTELYNWWSENKYAPYSLDELVKLLAKVKMELPPYVRIQRIMRDIPATLIEAGCNKSNLRQLVHNYLHEIGKECNCIRCREYGIRKRSTELDLKNLEAFKLFRLDYKASEGKEIFLSLENKKHNTLAGYLRLRKPSEYAHRPELNDGMTSIVREIKIVGELVPKDVDPFHEKQIQHRGYGTYLLEQAERISKDDLDCNKIAVISGIGVRDWFYKMNYQLDGPYVSKKI